MVSNRKLLTRQKNYFFKNRVNIWPLARHPSGFGFEDLFHTRPVRLFPLYLCADAFYLFVHLSNIFMQFFNRDRIKVSLGFRHVFWQIVVFQHL